MTYTYVISKNPTSEDFKALCKRIGELYPWYEHKGGKKCSDGAENDRWEKRNLVITAKLEADPMILTVTSNEKLPELVKEYRLKKWRAHERNERRFDIWNTFLGSSARVKFLLIPAMICLGWVLFTGLILINTVFPLSSFGDYLSLLVMPVSETLHLGKSFGWGWLWLIIAGLAVIRAARFKNPVIIKLLTAALPVLGIIYACIFGDFGDPAFYGDDFTIVLLITPFYLPVLLYMAALPYLVIDEIACRRLMKLTGSRPAKMTSAYCWGLSFMVSVVVLICFLIK